MSEPTEADIAEAIALAETEQDDVDKARDLLAIMLPSREDGEDWPLAEGIRALHDQWREADRRAIRAFEREFAATCRLDRLRKALVDAHVWLPFPSPIWEATKDALDKSKRGDTNG